MFISHIHFKLAKTELPHKLTLDVDMLKKNPKKQKLDSSMFFLHTFQMELSEEKSAHKISKRNEEKFRQEVDRLAQEIAR